MGLRAPWRRLQVTYFIMGSPDPPGFLMDLRAPQRHTLVTFLMMENKDVQYSGHPSLNINPYHMLVIPYAATCGLLAYIARGHLNMVNIKYDRYM